MKLIRALFYFEGVVLNTGVGLFCLIFPAVFVANFVPAGLPALAASTPGTLEAFEEAFFACLASRWPQEARRIQVGLSTQLKPEEDWQRSLNRAG